MATRSRKLCIESLEDRLPLARGAASASALVSIIDKSKKETVAVNGKLSGALLPQGIGKYIETEAGGTLTAIGQTALVVLPTSSRRATATLTTSAGTLTFALKGGGYGAPNKVTLVNGTGEYTGWSGGGTIDTTVTNPGLAMTHFCTSAVKLKLRM